MAERPIFVPSPSDPELVREVRFSIFWNSGFASSQKKKNIHELHSAAALAGYRPLLEISTKSQEPVGQRLSAFHLKVHHPSLGEIPLECAFQGSKVFENGGPYTDLYLVEPREAKRDERLQKSGRLTAFIFAGKEFPLHPTTLFYDWLYISALFAHREWLQRLDGFMGFTDIEFNPAKSVNCQARSFALLMSLLTRGELESALSSSEAFLDRMSHSAYSVLPITPAMQADQILF